MISNIKAARWLGWTSLAVGLTELAATRWVQEELGVEGREKLIQAFGVREIAAGATILSQPGLNATLAAALWGRVAGDAMDLAALGEASCTTDHPRGLARVTSIVLAITGIDLIVALGAQRNLLHARKAAAAAHRRVRQVDAVPSKSRAASANRQNAAMQQSTPVPSHAAGA